MYNRSMLGPGQADSTIVSIEEAIVTIVREATLSRLQERLVALSGAPVERAGYQVLRGLADAGPLRLKELARHLGVDSSTVSRHVQALETRGLIARRDDPDDGRASRVELTTEGKVALDRLRCERHRLFEEVLADWTVTDRALLAPLLVRLAADFVARGDRL